VQFPPYPPHWKTDRPDENFEDRIYQLYTQLDEFSRRYFSYPIRRHHIFTHGRDLWELLPNSETFVTYASHIAQPDPVMGGWNELLSDNECRSALVAGIISEVIQQQIFKKLLFGATDVQTEAMKSLEISLIGNDNGLILLLPKLES
jgi:hypothetical protein